MSFGGEKEAARLRAYGLLAWALLLLAMFWLVLPQPARACERTEVEWYNPTGWEGCTRYGPGLASRWPGPGVARNDCIWPWRSCTPIKITAQETGLSIVVTPKMFCDCYYGTSQEKLVDLDPAAVAALGLSWADGVYPVRVEPVASLPDTALR